MPEATPSSERFFDFTLRLLTIFVMVALAACTAFLGYRWVAPSFSRSVNGPFASPRPLPRIQANPALAGPALGDEVLMDPHRVFRCDDNGRVSFSDHACPSGDESVIPVAPPAARAAH